VFESLSVWDVDNAWRELKATNSKQLIMSSNHVVSYKLFMVYTTGKFDETCTHALQPLRFLD